MPMQLQTTRSMYALEYESTADAESLRLISYNPRTTGYHRWPLPAPPGHEAPSPRRTRVHWLPALHAFQYVLTLSNDKCAHRSMSACPGTQDADMRRGSPTHLPAESRAPMHHVKRQDTRLARVPAAGAQGWFFTTTGDGVDSSARILSSVATRASGRASRAQEGVWMPAGASCQ